LDAGEGVEEALWSGLLEALAYGGERPAFRRLASALPWAQLRAQLRQGPAAPQTSLAERAWAALNDAYASLAIVPARPARPGNGAERRLAGAAALAARFAGPGLAGSLIGPLAEPDTAAREIVAALTVPRLVGRARAAEVTANAVLPLAAALCTEPAASAVEGVFARLPLPARYGSVRHLHALTAGAVKAGMRRQQGMLYLLHQYCTQGGCGRCPLS
jgi:hypothetical protein